MARLVRKHLIVDADALRLLAEQRGTSESEVVREAVRQALAAEPMVQSLKQLHDTDTFADFEQLFGDTTEQVEPDPAP
jgi:Arc/MetJ-type ribon-helix-helix transcriptional regulator